MNLFGCLKPQLNDEEITNDKSTSKRKWNVVKGFLIGQTISIINASTYAMTNYLGQKSSSGTAIIQTISVYWSLPIILILVSLKYGSNSIVEFLKSVKWYYCLGITFCDISATFCLVIGIQNTNILSSQLISVCGIPFVMILSYFILKRRFNLIQVFSAIIALSGFILVSIADGQNGSSELIGDLLCLISTILYAIANTLQEKTVNIISPFSSMNYIIILSVHAPLLSLPTLLLLFFFPFDFNISVIELTLLIAYPLLQVIIYASIAFIILMTSAAFFNISNLSSSIYGLIYDMILFNKYPGVLSIIGALLIILSVMLYSFIECF
ncbi:membrane-spanning protein, putative [Entamoeba histolytica HM-1:IMSS-B]|uniref:Membrane-spanning protein, putative n=6 Tax=Entamoeba histolytica TaxID=5759 RepID=M3V032_ENTH1|nr:uncharacterized protein EHI_027630 [Entamoeba histolytica HM-1:IMSS]EMD44339.1 Hypothetical protein EHI5A_015340 [Entamoeba histolytica KU27]EMH77657.1 membrane-spanning protein, putative [Entamoeba histolytica HM-1:IMSS-B]EMS12629.1 membrane-spanning protein, putative [Entamoeba histolytica HM-3:IMSS]ENY60962.1 membrane-spanning protein, putative [Entamoeba histolytica HM-1:IMSS-A]GAT95217.1 hypothetical membrane-spanning protein [Entamoeba histolytica]|eukprot:XP_657548.1 uncharacterized protein EHI_027630 [Entamoeba histolytica HM-1:IMSS]